jgi:tRNA(Ile)-lysidine synthase TilS/MesJ
MLLFGSQSDQLHLGLAISGGVDSMALAALCSQLQDLSQSSVHSPKQSSLRPLQFRAFIVDHGLRAGSALEAEAVSRVLEGRGNCLLRTINSTWANDLRH